MLFRGRGSAMAHTVNSHRRKRITARPLGIDDFVFYRD